MIVTCEKHQDVIYELVLGGEGCWRCKLEQDMREQSESIDRLAEILKRRTAEDG